MENALIHLQHFKLRGHVLNAVSVVHTGPKQFLLQSLQLFTSWTLMTKNENSDPFL